MLTTLYTDLDNDLGDVLLQVVECGVEAERLVGCCLYGDDRRPLNLYLMRLNFQTGCTNAASKKHIQLRRYTDSGCLFAWKLSKGNIIFLTQLP